MKVQRLTALFALLVALAVLAFVLAGGPTAGTGTSGASAGDGPASASSPPGPARTGTPGPGDPAAPGGVANTSGLPEVKASELPAEARQTLALIAQGGPYPYSRDDASFGNFERILPRKSSGYYKEYTVRVLPKHEALASRAELGLIVNA